MRSPFSAASHVAMTGAGVVGAGVVGAGVVGAGVDGAGVVGATPATQDDRVTPVVQLLDV